MSQSEVVCGPCNETSADITTEEEKDLTKNIDATETVLADNNAPVSSAAKSQEIAINEDDSNEDIVESSTTHASPSVLTVETHSAASTSSTFATDEVTTTTTKPFDDDSECIPQNVNCSNDRTIEAVDKASSSTSTKSTEGGDVDDDNDEDIDSVNEGLDTPPLEVDSIGADVETRNDVLCDNLHVLDDQKQTTGKEHPSDQTELASSFPPDIPQHPRPSSTGAECSASASTGPISPSESVYHVKRITFRGTSVAMVTQNENGPCPLLAIANVLLLQRRICLPPQVALVTGSQLMERLADCLFQQAPNDVPAHNQLDYEQNRHDALAILHKLQTGLDVNVKFTGIGDFEYTPECIVFDLLGLRLCHGWLVDPECPAEVTAVGNCSYNQLVEKIIEQKSSSREELVTEALIAEEFLNRTAAQLTYYGLSELSTTLKEGELCIFFRNNHFCPLYHQKNELFLLVTDQGFLTESRVVWEVLSNVEGDGCFVDADLQTYVKPEPATTSISSPNLAPQEQIDQDYLVALSLQEEQDQESRSPCSNINVNSCLSDHELAMRLQAEEDRLCTVDQTQPQSARQPPATRRPVAAASKVVNSSTTETSSSFRQHSKSDCSIL